MKPTHQHLDPRPAIHEFCALAFELAAESTAAGANFFDQADPRQDQHYFKAYFTKQADATAFEISLQELIYDATDEAYNEEKQPCLTLANAVYDGEIESKKIKEFYAVILTAPL